MLLIANEVDPLIFHCVYFICDTNMYFSEHHSHPIFMQFYTVTPLDTIMYFSKHHSHPIFMQFYTATPLDV